MNGRPSRLDPAEMAVAAVVGVLRWLGAEQAGHEDRRLGPLGSLGWVGAIAAHVHGVAGEMTLCKQEGVYWVPTLGTYHDEPDVWIKGQPVEVRTALQHHYGLILRPEKDYSSLEHFWVLVTGCGPEFRVHGRIKGTEAVEGWPLTDPGEHGHPCHLVPQEALEQWWQQP